MVRPSVGTEERHMCHFIAEDFDEWHRQVTEDDDGESDDADPPEVDLAEPEIGEHEIDEPELGEPELDD